jgi:hypothetical protein
LTAGEGLQGGQPERGGDGLLIRVDALYFEVHYGRDLVATPYDGQDVIFKEAQAAPDQIPAEAVLLKTRIENIGDKVLSTIKDRSRREAYIQEIGGLGRMGLERGQLNVANEGLTSFQARFARNEGTRLRATYIRQMLRIGRYVGGPALLLGWVLWVITDGLSLKIANIFSMKEEAAHFALIILSSALFVLAGICLGATLSAYLRNRRVGFDNIGYFDTDDFDPALRYTFLAVVAAVLGLLLYKGWLIVGITQQLVLNSFTSDPGIAIIVGVITGYAEPNITRLVTVSLEAVRDWRSGSPADNPQ